MTRDSHGLHSSTIWNYLLGPVRQRVELQSDQGFDSATN